MTILPIRSVARVPQSRQEFKIRQRKLCPHAPPCNQSTIGHEFTENMRHHRRATTRPTPLYAEPPFHSKTHHQSTLVKRERVRKKLLQFDRPRAHCDAPTPFGCCGPTNAKLNIHRSSVSVYVRYTQKKLLTASPSYFRGEPSVAGFTLWHIASSSPSASFRSAVLRSLPQRRRGRARPELLTLTALFQCMSVCVCASVNITMCH